MTKPTPEEAAGKVAERLARTQEQTAIGLADGELGRAVLQMLAQADTISHRELVAHFAAIAADPRLASVERLLATEVIRRLEKRS